jgi:hypothetical protein
LPRLKALAALSSSSAAPILKNSLRPSVAVGAAAEVDAAARRRAAKNLK